MADEAHDLARRLHDQVRRRVLRRALNTDAKVKRLFDRLGQRLRRRFRLIGMTDAEVARAVEEEFRAVEEELLPDVERSLEAAAAGGNEAARRTLARIRGPAGREGADPFVAAPASRSHPTPALRLLRGSGGHSPGTA